jgi:drug/metabolite transporter (DMT)-like permease
MTRRGWILFIVLGLLWGMPYLLIRIAVGTIDPLVVAGSRTLIGALLLPAGGAAS